ncbi:MAG: NAD(P)/FAD-dependent oxidoreductase [Bacteroidales bacterium]
MTQYDVIVIGSGLGGLTTAVMLSKEGFRVCVLEKHAIIGGCLQSFKRRGQILDTGIHYFGSMDEGQPLNQYFKYFGILDKISLRRLDDACFDEIRIGDQSYAYAMKYDLFQNQLCDYFPNERNGIEQYCHTIQKIGRLIDVENLRAGKISELGMEYMGASGSGFIDSITQDERLRLVLAGTVTLYGGIRGVTSLYQHAMINHSNITGAYRLEDGTQQLADALAEQIRANGGDVFTNKEVTHLFVKDSKIESVEVNGEELFFGKQVISALHPKVTYCLMDKQPFIRKAYLSRINSLKNTYGMFSVHLILKPQSVRYQNKNTFYYTVEDAWSPILTAEGMEPASVFVSMQPASESPDYARVICILTPMTLDELSPWLDTRVGGRGNDYRAFKQTKADKIIRIMERLIPGITQAIESVHTATPLTYRDYTGIPDGSAYGIVKNSLNPLTTLLPVKTKVENLLLTGQNINLHGVLGCTITSAVTCSELIGAEYLAKKIGNA